MTRLKRGAEGGGSNGDDDEVVVGGTETATAGGPTDWEDGITAVADAVAADAVAAAVAACSRSSGPTLLL
jgi:hypothetical protein